MNNEKGNGLRFNDGKNRLDLVKKETQKLLDSLDIEFGAFNIEIMIDKNDKLYFEKLIKIKKSRKEE